MNPASMKPIRIVMPDGAPKIIRKELIPDARAIAIYPIRACKDRRLTAGLFRALGVMCSYANRAGLLWAGLERMGQDIGISQQAMQVYVKKLEALGYVETVYRGFRGERANTRRILYNPDSTLKETMQNTQTTAPFIAEKQAKQARKQAKKSQKQVHSIDNVQDVEQTPMQSVHDVMRLKNKVSDKIWQLAVQRANSETDYAAIKAAIDKLLR